MAELAYRPRSEFPDAVVMQDGHEIKISGSARWIVETDLFRARIGVLGSVECLRLQENYYAMGRRLLLSSERAEGARKAWFTYWGNRHIEIANGYFDALNAQHDWATFVEDVEADG